VYVVIRLVRVERRPAVVASLIALGVLAGALTAVQLFTGIQVNSEGTRNDHVSRAFAALFSFPPENLLTLLVPHVLGDMVDLPYWGRWYLWEACLFASVAAVPLIGIGWASGSTERRKLWATMAIVFFVIALGKYTPLFDVLYRYVPGLSKFRSYAKFIYEVSIFLALLAAAGLDAVLRGKASLRLAGWITAVLSVGLFALGFSVRGDVGLRLAQWIGNLGDTYFDPSHMDIVEFVAKARQFASIHILSAALIGLVVGLALIVGRSWPRAAYVIAAISVIELCVFARSMITTFDPQICKPAYMTRFYASHPGDYKILNNAFSANSAIAYGANEVWGYDPMVLRRYAELLSYAEKANPNDATMFLTLDEISPTLRIIGCKYVLNRVPGKVYVTEISKPQPRAAVVHEYLTLKKRDDAFRMINDLSFDGTKEVVLEAPPPFAPMPPGGAATARWRGTDQIEVDARTPTPGMIVLTDTYSRFWQLSALPGSAQSSYTAQPANYTEIGIPVQAGSHRILLTYRPSMFVVGAWVSAIAWLGFLAALRTTGKAKNEQPPRHAVEGAGESEIVT
jgi:hypothetical protein